MMNVNNTQTNSFDHTKINSIKEDFSKKYPTGCPYHAMIAQVNKISAALTKDSRPPITKIIAAVYKDIKGFLLNAPSLVAQQNPNASDKSKAKISKHVYDILFLETQVAELIHTIMVGLKESWQLASVKNLPIDIHDRGSREVVGELIRDHLYDVVAPKLIEWDIAQKGAFYWYADKYANAHSTLNKRGGPYSFATMFMQGVMDAYSNCWSLILHLPDLYYAKYGRWPSKDTYVLLVEKHMKSVVTPSASIDLISLIYGLRGDYNQDDHILDINNALISPETHTLDENDNICLTPEYIAHVHDGISVYINRPNRGDYPVRTGCPALVAKTADGEPIIKQFLEDVIGLFDKTYFERWE